MDKSSKQFVGGVASGKGRVIKAQESSYTIEAYPPLNAQEYACAIQNGFDDESWTRDWHNLRASKEKMRKVGGDINYVAMVLTNKDTGRGR